jgi:hypothetical protein
VRSDCAPEEQPRCDIQLPFTKQKQQTFATVSPLRIIYAAIAAESIGFATRTARKCAADQLNAEPKSGMLDITWQTLFQRIRPHPDSNDKAAREARSLGG